MTTGPNPTRAAVDQYGPWVAMYAAIALTASGEFELATLVGFPNWIAWAFPTAIDVYVIQAIRRRRDVAAAISLGIVANALYHLAAAGLFGVSKHSAHGHETYDAKWWLIVGVAAVAPLIVWRVHRITETHAAPEEASGSIPVGDSRRPPLPAKPAGSIAPTGAVPALPAATETPAATSTTVAPEATSVGDKTPPVVADNSRQNAPADGDSSPAKTTASRAARKKATASRPAGKKAPRRSLTEWVDIASPIFHAEFARLRRQPTANEFATAIDAAGLGRVSDSTAKNIRTEILDRAEVPALDDTP